MAGLTPYGTPDLTALLMLALPHHMDTLISDDLGITAINYPTFRWAGRHCCTGVHRVSRPCCPAFSTTRKQTSDIACHLMQPHKHPSLCSTAPSLRRGPLTGLVGSEWLLKEVIPPLAWHPPRPVDPAKLPEVLGALQADADYTPTDWDSYFAGETAQRPAFFVRMACSGRPKGLGLVVCGCDDAVPCLFLLK